MEDGEVHEGKGHTRHRGTAHAKTWRHWKSRVSLEKRQWFVRREPRCTEEAGRQGQGKREAGPDPLHEKTSQDVRT